MSSIHFLQSQFKDIEEIDPSDKYNILHIDSSDYHQKLNSIFRSILEKNEISERVFLLTKLIIEASSTNYMGWYIRRKCLDVLQLSNEDNKNELDWMNEVTLQNPKNYQLWNHRKIVVDRLSSYSNEIDIINKIFDEESKNYHAWCHRIWVTRRYNQYNSQYEYSTYMINKDVRNNSAWNFRYFTINYMVESMSEQEKADFLKNEISFSLRNLKLDYENESCLSYMLSLGLIKSKKVFEMSDELTLFCEEIDENTIEKRFLIELKIEFLKFLLSNQDKEKERKIKEMIVFLYIKLSEIDYIRKKYWMKMYLNYID